MDLKEEKVEILAPAGSYDILTAAFAAGADAVYLGGTMFGARAYANNFDREELLRALDYAHLHDKKIYLTVNTLTKQTEIDDRLLPYLEPFYEAGLDAVIVQDFGVFQKIREAFPGLHIHASTQMTATGAESAKVLQRMGASRVVTARELSLAEIKAIHESCDIEIESFIHGALCYCYSGQCLFSSFNGGRSGNRGRCAQPCRLAYSTEQETRSNYLLSPKDMCGLTILPDIIEAGVYSLKIEGRMKNVNYAAGVTEIYRKYVDMYLERGRAGFAVADSDLNDLMDLYNRGAFTTGYYNNTKGREMLSLSRPNHMGTKALKVINNSGGRVTFEALEQIYPQDVFEIDKDNSFESGGVYGVGERFVVNLPKRYRLQKGKILYRMKNGELTRSITKEYVGKRLKKRVAATLTAAVGKPLELAFTDLAAKVTVSRTGDIVQAAEKQPADKERLASLVSSLGDTDFAAESVAVNLQGDVFVPVGKLKELRRSCIEGLQETVLAGYKRTALGAASDKEEIPLQQCAVMSSSRTPQITLLVTDMQQAESAYALSQVHTIYYDFHLFCSRTADSSRIAACVKRCREAGKTSVLALPHILRGKHTEKIRQLAKDWLLAGAGTFLVRNLEALEMLSELGAQEAFAGKIKVVADTNLYTWNRNAISLIQEMCQNLTLLYTTAPLELTAQELAQQKLSTENTPRELIVYTHIPLMFSEQCVKRTLGQCDGKSGRIQIVANQAGYQVQSVCSLCYSILYDSKVYDISDMTELIALVNPDSIRYELTDSTVRDAAVVLDGRMNCEKVSRGHFELGVE